MNVTHVVPHISEEASGPSYSVPRLCQIEAALGNAVELVCLAAGRAIEGINLEVYRQLPVLARFAISHSFVHALYHKAAQADIVHNHSLWSMVNVASGWVVPDRGAKLVVSPRGTLSTWALSRSRHVKSILWPLQRRVLARADLLHATSKDEYHEIRALGFKAPVVIIPNGIDLPYNLLSETSLPKKYRTLLFLSRIHPKKGIDRLLQAWAQLQSRYPDWRLVIAGKGEVKHVKEIKKLAAALQLERVEFPGPLYGEDKKKTYYRADLFVLPTHSENFGLVVAEALAHRCPAVVSRGAPWADLEDEACGWWVDNGVEALTASLNQAMQLPPQDLQTMGMRGRDWMERDYSWESIGQKMVAAYQWVLNGGSPLEWVRID